MATATISKTEESLYKTQLNCLNFFFSSCGSVYQGCEPPGVRVNKKYCTEVLVRLRKRLMRVRMEIADCWVLRATSLQRSYARSVASL